MHVHTSFLKSLFIEFYSSEQFFSREENSLSLSHFFLSVRENSLSLSLTHTLTPTHTHTETYNPSLLIIVKPFLRFEIDLEFSDRNCKKKMASGFSSVGLPPGFRFHPTDEELITHYLSPKVLDSSFCATAIGEVDLNKIEPWDLPCKF